MKPEIKRRYRWIRFTLHILLISIAGGFTATADDRISHNPPGGAYIPGFRLQLDVDVQNSGDLLAARCYFKTKQDQNFAFVDLCDQGAGKFKAVLPAPWINSEAVEYLFVVVDRDKQVTRSPLYALEEGKTREAGQWKDAGQVREVRLDTMQETVEDCELVRRQLRDHHAKKLPKYQTVDEAGPLTVQTELSKDLVPLSGFYDKAMITQVSKGARYGLMADGLYEPGQIPASGLAGHSTGFWVGTGVLGAAAVGGTAAALSGGGGGGGGNGGGGSTPDPPADLTEQTIIGAWNLNGSATSGYSTVGTITFIDDGTFTYNYTVYEPGGSSHPGGGTGTWTLSGDYLTMTFDAGAVYQGQASGDSKAFTMLSDNGWTLNFTR